MQLIPVTEPKPDDLFVLHVETAPSIIPLPDYPGVPGGVMPGLTAGNISRNNSSTPPTIAVDVASNEITVLFTVINVVCFVCFCPVNLKSMKLYLNILQHGHPFFGLLMAFQGLCMLDLLVCFSEAVTLWVEVPLWVCRYQIGTSHTIHLALSLSICFICAYRLVQLMWLPQNTLCF